MWDKLKLYLHEEILLLCLKDKEGTMNPWVNYQFGLAGAILAELLLQKRVTIATEKKHNYVQIVDTTPIGDPLLDEALQLIIKRKKRAEMNYWVPQFTGIKKLKNRIAQQLVNKGILRAEQDKVLLLFTRNIYPEVNPEPEHEIIERLRAAIFTEKSDLDAPTVILIALADSIDLLKTIFDKSQLKEQKNRLKQIANGDLIGQATREAIQAMQAAIMVACIIPAVITATAHH